MIIHERFAHLRTLYPDDIARIEVEEAAVAQLLRQQEHYNLEETQAFVTLCRKDIVSARLKIASNRNLTPEQHSELWQIVDAREWFLKLVVKDFDAELEQIDRELEAQLS